MITSYVARLLRRGQQRKALSDLVQLDDHLLRDIGLSRAEVNGAISSGRPLVRHQD
jgi:uncharacterized protein YjiS (DUF1127 family)